MIIPRWKLYLNLVLASGLAGSLIGGGIGAMISTDPKIPPDALGVYACGGACVGGGFLALLALLPFASWCSEAKPEQFSEMIVLATGKPDGDEDEDEW